MAIGSIRKTIVYYEAIKRGLNRRHKSVGVMKDSKLKLRELHASIHLVARKTDRIKKKHIRKKIFGCAARPPAAAARCNA